MRMFRSENLRASHSIKVAQYIVFTRTPFDTTPAVGREMKSRIPLSRLSHSGFFELPELESH